MRFFIGLITGVIVGAAAANISTGQSGDEIRREFERIRSDIEKRDFDALGSHLEDRFAQLQTNLEEKFASAEKATADAAEEAAEAAQEATAEADEAVEEAEAVPA